MDLSKELAAYFSRVDGGGYAHQYKNEVNLFSQDQAKAESQLFDGLYVIDLLGGVILDDPNTSNHHVFATRSPLAGQVFYLSHDGESRIVFDSLADFVAAADDALQEGLWLSEMHPGISPVCHDQAGLSELIRTLCASDDPDHEAMAVSLMPSLDLRDKELLNELADSDNFFIVEAIAEEIQKRPQLDLLVIAERCRQHPHEQAARAGEAAVFAIQSITIADEHRQF